MSFWKGIGMPTICLRKRKTQAATQAAKESSRLGDVLHGLCAQSRPVVSSESLADQSSIGGAMSVEEFCRWACIGRRPMPKQNPAFSLFARLAPRLSSFAASFKAHIERQAFRVEVEYFQSQLAAAVENAAQVGAKMTNFFKRSAD